MNFESLISRVTIKVIYLLIVIIFDCEISSEAIQLELVRHDKLQQGQMSDCCDRNSTIHSL